jgi:hypothetical protein
MNFQKLNIGYYKTGLTSQRKNKKYLDIFHSFVLFFVIWILILLIYFSFKCLAEKRAFLESDIWLHVLCIFRFLTIQTFLNIGFVTRGAFAFDLITFYSTFCPVFLSLSLSSEWTKLANKNCRFQASLLNAWNYLEQFKLNYVRFKINKNNERLPQ